MVRHAFLISLLFLGSVFFSSRAAAEVSDHEFETQLRERNRDFDHYVKSRANDAEAESKAAIALRAERLASEARKTEIEKDYQRNMKRYSMEEVEARDRADEARLERLGKDEEKTRATFISRRNRQRILEASVGSVNTYEEFEINMAVPPETKASQAEAPAQSEK